MGRQQDLTSLSQSISRNRKSQTFIIDLMQCFNKIMVKEEIPESWLKSLTVMIPKNKKPEAKNLRPKSLTNISYRIFMIIIRNRTKQKRKHRLDLPMV